MSQTTNPVLAAYAFHSRKVKKNGDGFSIQEKWIVPSSVESDFLSAKSVGSNHAIYPQAVLADIESGPIDGEGDQIFEYVLTYDKFKSSARGSIGGKSTAPPVESLPATPESASPIYDLYESDGMQEDVSIEDHPSYSPTWETSKPNVDSYLAPGMIWRKTVYVDASWNPTENDLVQGVFRIEVPEGLNSPTPNSWLRLPNQIRIEGNHYVFVKSWRYTPTPDGWDADIYGS